MNNAWLLIRSIMFVSLTLMVAAPSYAFSIYYDDARHEQLQRCDQINYQGNITKAQECFEGLLDHEDILTRANAAAAIGDVRTANKLYREASSNSDNPAIKTNWAQLYTQTHQLSDAVSILREVLLSAPEYLPAQLAMVEVTMKTYEGQARQALVEIINKEPDNAHAYLLQAKIELELQNVETARTILTKFKALAESQGHTLLEYYALQASANLLKAEPYMEWVDKALAINASYGQIYSTIAHYYIITYRYREAVELYKKAIALNKTLASAQRDLGINYLRINNIFGARYHIRRAFDLDPFDAETVNTLRLLDKLDGMRISSVDVPDPKDPDQTLGRVLIRLDAEDADALEPYVEDLAIRAMQTFTERYQFKLQRPMIVELYHDHDDFGVRTVSTPGIGLLGVTFGYLTAMDSPKARPVGEFHWGSTLWHEIAHVFTLEATNHKLPRWLSEGLSVYEEWNTGPLPERAIPIETLLAISKQQLLPIDSLDSGFVRPSYKGQVQVSYNQAGLICDFIAKRWGHEALVVLLKAYINNVSTSDALFDAIGLHGVEFDRLFLAYVEESFGELARSLDGYQTSGRQLGRAVAAKDWVSAGIIARNVIAQDPTRVGSGNAYEVLAKSLREQGSEDESMEVLSEWHKLGGHGVESLQILVRELRKRDRFDEAAVVMESINWVNPYVVEEHRWLGDYYLANNDAARALREYDALLGLQANDPAEALLGKAKASLQLGDKENAKRQLLYALENAPFFRSAQQLLLEFNEGDKFD